jgi:serine/threonine-protein kinase SRPK3
MTFEMLTGELLFNPRKDNNDSFGKNDDHLAQMMELLGRFPKKFTCRGLKNKKYFSKDGNLVRIPKLQNWSLKDVMIAKYSPFYSGIASPKIKLNFSKSSWARC